MNSQKLIRQANELGFDAFALNEEVAEVRVPWTMNRGREYGYVLFVVRNLAQLLEVTQ